MYFYLTFQSDFQYDIGTTYDVMAEVNACSDEGDFDKWYSHHRAYELPQGVDRYKNALKEEERDYAMFLAWKEWTEAREAREAREAKGSKGSKGRGGEEGKQK